jgi:curved DNA-binding protein CbpA
MECNKDEALRAKALAERKMVEKDFVGARKMINKAQQLSSEVDNISQMLTVCDVHCAAGTKVNGEIDWYGVLQVPVFTNDDTLIKKQYRKLCLLLHPDKNKFAGAEAAFKLVGEANTTLTDSSKRSVYDMKRRGSVRVAAVRPSPYQQARRAAPVRPVNLHQPPNPAGPGTFWTICSNCGMRYQYYTALLKKAIRCQKCMKPFIAHDLNNQAVPPATNQQSAGVNRGAGAPSGFNQQSAGVNRSAGAPQNFPGPQINVPGQQAQNYATQGVRANATANKKRGAGGNGASAAGEPKENARFARTSKGPSTSGLKRGRKSRVESSDSESTSDSDSEEEIIVNGSAGNNAKPSEHSRRSVRQKQEVQYKEESDDEDVDDDGNDNDAVDSSNFKRLRKGGTFHSDDQSNETEMNEDRTGHNGSANGLNHSVGSNGLDPNLDALDEDKFSCADPEFFNFDQLRDVSQFKANQIWAVYDSQGCMPRFYARITKVKMAPKFIVQFVWLEFDPTNKAEEVWSSEALPAACGHFKVGDSGTAKEANMFSHTMCGVKSKIRSMFEIYPRKGEVWALFKGWDIGWSSDADEHTDFQYEVVQVVSDLTAGTGIIAMPLVKVKGFVSLFMQSKEATPYVIPQDNTLRFSHLVPSYVMSGTEREGIPEGALELDPAALPLNLEEAFASVVPDSSSVKGQEFDTKCAGSSSGNNSGKVSMRVGETAKEKNMEHITPPAVEATDDDASDDIAQGEFEVADSEFFEFSEIRLLHKLEPGQVWAIYSDVDKFPNFYALIKNVDLKNNKVKARWLDVCPQGEEEKRLVTEDRTVGCGTFKVSTGRDGNITYTGTESFSHHVLARPTGRKNEYEIIPRPGEIWAIYKNWRAGWSAQDFQNCEYEFVEILAHTDKSIQVQLLRKVDGYTAVFRRDDAVKTISKDEYPKFSHQVPCFHLTNEKGGKLRGYLELDPNSLPDALLST